jgi:hypothetical protein
MLRLILLKVESYLRSAWVAKFLISRLTWKLSFYTTTALNWFTPAYYMNQVFLMSCFYLRFLSKNVFFFNSNLWCLWISIVQLSFKSTYLVFLHYTYIDMYIHVCALYYLCLSNFDIYTYNLYTRIYISLLCTISSLLLYH